LVGLQEGHPACKNLLQSGLLTTPLKHIGNTNTTILLKSTDNSLLSILFFFIHHYADCWHSAVHPDTEVIQLQPTI